MSGHNEDFSTYSASDYAGIDVPRKGIKLYYGYEITDHEDNWCFKATYPKGTLTIPFPDLKQNDPSLRQWDCESCLMVGIALFIERGALI